MSDTPSARIVNVAQALKIVTDATGRRITFRAMTVLDQARAYRAMGGDAASNGPYASIALVACSVVEIDGVPRPAPKSLPEMDAAIGALGDDGYIAVYAESQRMQRETMEAAGLPNETETAAKNSPSTLG